MQRDICWPITLPAFQVQTSVSQITQ